MGELPAPLTPSDCDLRDFAFMPLDVRRLRDSDTAALDDAEAFRAAVLLWCAAWHSVPAASLPDDDAALCRLAGYGRDMKTWKRAREGGALSGFTKCSDGRLYHQVIAEKATDSWTKKQGYRDRMGKARIAKKQAQSNGDDKPKDKDPDAPIIGAIIEPIIDPVIDPIQPHKGEEEEEGEGEGEEEGKGEEQGKEEVGSLRSLRARDAEAAFERFWPNYPRKDGKGYARKAFLKALTKASEADIIAGLARYRFSPDPQYIPMPATWLNGEYWLSEQSAPTSKPDARMDAMAAMLNLTPPAANVATTIDHNPTELRLDL